MAVKDSGELAWGSGYNLGDYSFRIERSSVPGSNNDKIEAICTDKDGKNARKSIQLPSSTIIDGWYVEANETEATVYITIKSQGGTGYISDLDTGIPQPIRASEYIRLSQKRWDGSDDWTTEFISNGNVKFMLVGSGSLRRVYVFGERHEQYTRIFTINNTGESTTTVYEVGGGGYSHNNKTVYYSYSIVGSNNVPLYEIVGADYDINPDSISMGAVGWTVIFGTFISGESGDKIIGRFAIELEDAGGVGPGSDWTDPGDYDPDWEEGDPTHTLYVTITGALSGRHNDPIEDPSYSYIPSDKDTVKDYGCGGDGGHGGGGGAGASTVVVYKFATNQANSKEVTAIARRHGYGSGGGKGGKGGDGCILVYY